MSISPLFRWPNSVCHYRDGDKEVAALMACTSR
ncbi:Hok/Gef family protein [Escherichia coli]